MWTKLLAIPFGECRTYDELSKEVDAARARRADRTKSEEARRRYKGRRTEKSPLRLIQGSLDLPAEVGDVLMNTAIIDTVILTSSKTGRSA
jgi:hypothetical protein